MHFMFNNYPDSASILFQGFDEQKSRIRIRIDASERNTGNVKNERRNVPDPKIIFRQEPDPKQKFRIRFRIFITGFDITSTNLQLENKIKCSDHVNTLL